ncbi:MAG: hypothetical protein OEU36_17055 [Gammaproteobacteria bacterium]|nr:hypothetical protein [Gammaproteobacteria bacterium]
MTDLPSLDPFPPKPEDYLAAITKSSNAGCTGGVLSHSWPSLEPSEGQFTLDELKGAATLNEGRVLFLGVQVLNTTSKDLPTDLESMSLDDPELIRRFKVLLDGLSPLLQSKVLYLSIGNEVDIYLSFHPAELEPFKRFLEEGRTYAKKIASHLIVGTTVTDNGLLEPKFRDLTASMDAHFLTYYHGQHGTEGVFKNSEDAKEDLLNLVNGLDSRPLVIQEIGYPAHSSLSSPEKQTEFVRGFFDAWDEVGERIPFANYFLLYDFPQSFAENQAAYYGVTAGKEKFVNFLVSLGLHTVGGEPKPAWEVFKSRGKSLTN